MIVASLNYRLGIFGFLSHRDLSKESASHSSGNYGLLDQIAALKWIKANIAAFGGDPDRVTIFGSSAGGSSVLYLLASPLARGLFRGAIAQSAALVIAPMQHRAWRAYGRESAEAEGARIASRIAWLRALPADEVLAKARPLDNVDPARLEFFPTVDGHVIPAEPADLFEQGRVARVPLIIGNTSDEGTLFARRLPVKTAAEWRAFAQHRYPIGGEDLVARYPVRTDADAFTAVSRYLTDWLFAGTTRGAARAMATHSRSVWRYELTRVNPGAWPFQQPPLGAFHSSELPYVFGRLLWRRPGPSPYDATDHALAANMSAAWVRFAGTGDPNGGDLPGWPQYTAAAEQRMAFGDTITVGLDPNREVLDAYDRAFIKMRRAYGR